jgi:predicted DNA-binding transcriptional regulator YafY
MPSLSAKRPGPLSLLMDAVKRREAVAILYQGVARGLATRRTIEPLAVVRLGSTWLVPAYCRLREDLRVFRVDLMAEAEATGERFAPRPGLSLEDFVRMKENEPRPSAS